MSGPGTPTERQLRGELDDLNDGTDADTLDKVAIHRDTVDADGIVVDTEKIVIDLPESGA